MTIANDGNAEVCLFTRHLSGTNVYCFTSDIAILEITCGDLRE